MTITDEKLKDQEIVRNRYPQAYCERMNAHSGKYFLVFGNRSQRDRLGEGATEKIAWQQASARISNAETEIR